MRKEKKTDRRRPPAEGIASAASRAEPKDPGREQERENREEEREEQTPGRGAYLGAGGRRRSVNKAKVVGSDETFVVARASTAALRGRCAPVAMPSQAAVSRGSGAARPGRS